jgi:hypothetical protein
MCSLFARGAAALACVVVFHGGAGAQPGTPISGTIVDRSGLALPDASVRVRSAGGQVVAETRSGPDGTFGIPRVPVGATEIEVQLAGFRTGRTALDAPTRSQDLTIVLDVACFTDTVTVTASRDERPLAAVPASVGVVSRAVLEQGPGVSLV